MKRINQNIAKNKTIIFKIRGTLLKSTHHLDQFNLISRLDKLIILSANTNFPKGTNFYHNPHHNHQPMKKSRPKNKTQHKNRTKEYKIIVNRERGLPSRTWSSGPMEESPQTSQTTLPWISPVQALTPDSDTSTMNIKRPITSIF
jgi:hypothetical protein